ncbi:hypothetical protein T459_11435 [Capsicum annuum]|uniref:Protein kinase domain-containing protein n=1 Tax=Capsicum annuum TaxID=4072 RepID=A0A2G2ZLY0_CAPAN|nr:hypothetical protein T459_11435 [Capsicum annuum]
MTFVLLWIRYRRGKRASQQADSLSAITSERISYYELLQATDALSECNLIGSGSFSSVYKCVLRSGTAIAVKVFNLQLDAAFKSFYMECEVLRAFAIGISQRLSIMIDVACALEYLHHGCSLVVIHCDLKPSNVLLDEDMVAHLSDFGISKLLGEDQEYGLDGLVSTKFGVYSYGVMLLETFTMRKPNEFEGDLSLKQWKELDVVASIMKVALDCCVESPARRTNMKDVVGMLQKIKIQLLAC